MNEAWDKYEEQFIDVVTELLRAGVSIDEIVQRAEGIAEFEAGEDA